eukprot:scaffold21761_cov31-Tisochrysis_lutea.AAC.3
MRGPPLRRRRPRAVDVPLEQLCPRVSRQRAPPIGRVEPPAFLLCEILRKQVHGGGTPRAILEGHSHVEIYVGLNKLFRSGALGASKELTKVNPVPSLGSAHVRRLVHEQQVGAVVERQLDVARQQLAPLTRGPCEGVEVHKHLTTFRQVVRVAADIQCLPLSAPQDGVPQLLSASASKGHWSRRARHGYS